MKAIVKNLLNRTSKEIMICENCGNQYSANKGDYWNFPDNYKFVCCDRTMDLVIPITTYIRVTKETRK